MNEQGTRDALSSRWEAGFRQVRALADDGAVPEGVAEAERLVAARRPRHPSVRLPHRAGAGGRRPRRSARRGRLLPRRRSPRPGLPGVRRPPASRRRTRRRRLPRHGPGTASAPWPAAAYFPRRPVPEGLGRSGTPFPLARVAYRAFVRAKVSLIQARRDAGRGGGVPAAGLDGAAPSAYLRRRPDARRRAAGQREVHPLRSPGGPARGHAAQQRPPARSWRESPRSSPRRPATARESTRRSGRPGPTPPCSTARPPCCPRGNRRPGRHLVRCGASGRRPCAWRNAPAPTWWPCTAMCRGTWQRRA
ncbi:hypothetical protein SALBM217S_05507 [Streptomyces griseoloalbus]